ncbi:MAG: type II secretion system F family protein [Gammaproteobacteria bacterium]
MADKSTLSYLAQLLDSHIAPIEASIRLLNICPDDKQAISQLIKNLRLGCTLAESVNQAEFTSQLEHEILKVAELSGKTSEALRFISSNIIKRQKRSHDLRMRLILPNAIIFIMLAIYTIRAMTAGSGIGSILISSIPVLTLSISITYLLISLVRHDASYWISFGWRLGLQTSSNKFRSLSDHFFFTLFYWQQDAGIDYISGAKILNKLFNASAFQQSMSNYLANINKGKTVTDALSDAHLLAAGELQQVIKTGENSGRLAHALKHFLKANQLHIDQSTDIALMWIPRIYYLITMIIGVKIYCSLHIFTQNTIITA